MKPILPVIGCLLALAHGAAAGTCFTVHGRMQSYNGAPAFRIWRPGTSRVLGVHDEEEGYPRLPASLQRAFGSDAFGKRVYADFVLCPLTKQRPGWMQIVRVKSASNILVK